MGQKDNSMRHGEKKQETAGRLSQENNAARTVQGRVFTTDRQALPGVNIQLLNVSIAGESQALQEEVLSEGKADENGYFELNYRWTQQQNKGRGPDLKVLAISSEGNRVLGHSPVRYNAAPVVTIYVVADSKTIGLPSEYEQITGTLTNLLRKDRRFGTLREKEGKKEITYLGNKSGWDSRLVAMVALADRFSSGTKIEPGLFYALFRAGMPANETFLFRLEKETILECWEKAIEQNIIPAIPERQLEKMYDLFQKRRASFWVSEEAPLFGLARSKELLGIVLNQKERDAYARIFYETKGSELSFFEAVAKSPLLKQKLGSLVRLWQWAAQTANNVSLIRKTGLDDQGALKDLRQLARNDFHKPETWLEYLHDQDAESLQFFPGETANEQRRNYAAFLANQLKISYPATVLARRIELGEVPIQNGLSTQVCQFLYDCEDKLILAAQSIGKFVQEKGLEVSSTLMQELKRLQRAIRLCPDDNALGFMMGAGLDSAQAVMKYSQKRFLATYKDALGGDDSARRLYARAKNVCNAVLNIASTCLAHKSAPPLFPHFPNGNGRGKGFELEGLFGNLDFPSCEHNASLLSPAAYFVELLEFLKEGNPEARDVLLKRRPDLEYLELSGENTDIILPYVDLVNEILEYQVVNNLSLDGFTGYNMEPGVQTEDLLANPQHVNRAAYSKLKEPVFPLALPFNRHLEELRLYFGAMDISLPEALKKIKPEETKAIIQETLGLSPEEYRILTQMNSLPYTEYFGIPIENEQDLFNKTAKELVRILDLSYEELVDLLKTRFVNPGAGLIPDLEKLDIPLQTIAGFLNGAVEESDFREKLLEKLNAEDVEAKIAWLNSNKGIINSIIVLTAEEPSGFGQLTLRYADGNCLRPLSYVRINRFVRLWKKLGWDMESLDKAVVSFSPLFSGDHRSEEAEALLASLAGVKTVMEKLGTPAKDLVKALSLWAPMDTFGPNSLYRQLFLNPSVIELDPVFGKYLENHFEQPLDSVESHSEALLAALNLTAEELQQVAGNTKLSDIELSLENISLFYRHAFLARSLRISIKELSFLIRLSGADPFLAPSDKLPFINLVQRIKETGFKPSQLAYLLLGEDWSGEASPKEQDIRAMARTIRDDLKRIESENEVKDDPEGKILREKMVLLFEESATGIFFKILGGEVGQAENLFGRYPQLELMLDCWDENGDKNAPEKYKVLLEYLFENLGLKEKLKKTQLQQTLGSKTGLAPELLEALLNTEGLIKNDARAIEDFLNLEIRGSAAPLTEGHFFLEVPKNEYFQFSVEPGGIVEFPEMEKEDAIWLEAGRLYQLDVKTFGGGANFTLNWQALGIPKGPIPSEQLFPAGILDAFRSSYLQLLKIAAIAGQLKLQPEELLYFCREDLWEWLDDLMRYTLARKTLEIKDDSLMKILQDPKSANEAGENLLSKITGWMDPDTEGLALLFEGKDPRERLSHFLPFMEKNQLAHQLGIALSALEECVTNQPEQETIGKIKGALRAKYNEAGWRKIITPINDELRNRSRDALVACLLGHMQQQSEKCHIDTADKLFEHLLIDVSMDACMKTSRLKQAISSAQLFITRCLMNLEPEAAPSCIDGERWAWMKRYRVWEANRKVFLFPENWLEPELRDDKSPIFREFESELLESDITEDSAVTAIYHYLEKLDDIARLDVVALCYDESQNQAADGECVMHVIGKTPGSLNQFFYRRKEFGVWSPWEPIGLEIDGEPVLPVVWNGRLFLFWLNLMVTSEQEDHPKLADVKKDIETLNTCISGVEKVLEGVPSGINPRIENALQSYKDQLAALFEQENKLESEPRLFITLSVALSWSEYHKGKWQSVHNSDLGDPVFLNRFKADSDKFKPEDFLKKIRLSSHIETMDNQEALVILADYGAMKLKRFTLYSKHGFPEQSSVQLTDLPENKEAFRHRVFTNSRNNFDVAFFRGEWRRPFFGKLQFLFDHNNKPRQGSLVDLFRENMWEIARHTLLEKASGRAVFPRHDSGNPFDIPFFFLDRQHVFLVWPKFRMVTVSPGHGGSQNLVELPPYLTNVPPEPLKIWFRPDRFLPDPVDVQFRDALLGDITDGPNLQGPSKDETILIGQGPSRLLTGDHLLVFDDYIIGVQDAVSRSLFENQAENILGNSPFTDAL